jgi:hypothetical protein
MHARPASVFLLTIKPALVVPIGGELAGMEVVGLRHAREQLPVEEVLRDSVQVER